LLVAALYILWPVDAVPDAAAPLGWMDDFLVFLAALWWLWRSRSGGPPAAPTA
jgi:uncharacterized membrane protein YkvA (DUF1232 family)